MDKNTILNIIKYNYINQFKSLNYNLKNSYPVTWNKDLFTESIKDINFKNIKLIKDQYINAITSSLNLDDINNTTYDDAINNLLRSTNININELEYILKEYIDENKDNLDNLQPVNALNNTNLMSKLDMLHNGYYILNGSNNSNQSLFNTNQSLLKSSMDQKIQNTERELLSRIKDNEGKIIELNQTLLNLKKK